MALKDNSFSLRNELLLARLNALADDLLQAIL
jgi:hypothetical protein